MVYPYLYMDLHYISSPAENVYLLHGDTPWVALNDFSDRKSFQYTDIWVKYLIHFMWKYR